MTEEAPTLFGSPLPDPRENSRGPMHRGGLETEAAAASFVMPRTGTWRWRVLHAIHVARDMGLTDWELHRLLGGNLYTIAPRRTELRDGGWIEDSGKRRRTNNGARAVVWVLSERARREMAALGKERTE